ncbi:MAG: HAD family hydrolase [Clostridia bacterium]|nr:HAD family hydrolase [Clostridia bacterium]
MSETLYISDLDGTLLNQAAELSEYTKNALNGMIANGLHFTVATARTLSSSGKILAGLTLGLPVALMNGVLIYDGERQCYAQTHTFPPDAIPAVIRTLRAFETTGFMYELTGGEMRTYHESRGPRPLHGSVEARIAHYHKSFRHRNSFSDAPPEHIIYFTMIDTREQLQPVHDALLALPDLNMTLYKDNYSTDLWFLEVFSAKASKGSAATYFKETYGYRRIVGFGDNLNDLPLFAGCDVRVAVENAKAEVKSAADAICGANDGDGVVKWLEEHWQ